MKPWLMMNIAQSLTSECSLNVFVLEENYIYLLEHRNLPCSHAIGSSYCPHGLAVAYQGFR